MIDYIIWRQRDNEILDRTLAAWDPLLLLKGLAIRLKRRYLAGPLDALWILCSSDGLIGWRNLLQPQVYEGVISAINKRGPATVRSATEPLLALVKYRWLNCTVSQSEAIAMLKYSIMPTETAVELPAVILSALLQDKIHDPGIFWDIFRIRRAEAALCILTDLLDICCVATPPARAAEAVKYLEIDPLLGDPIHEAHQLHLANSIQKIAQMAQEAATGYEHQKLLHAAVKLHIWDPETGIQWLNHPVMRETLKYCFAECARTLLAVDSSEQDFIKRLNDVVKGLECAAPSDDWHMMKLKTESRRQKCVELLEEEMQLEASAEAILELEEDPLTEPHNVQ
jgi:hypothetical protein